MDFDFRPETIFPCIREKDAPIFTNLADTDSYKITMNQMFRHRDMGYNDVMATFSFINRDPSMRLADVIDEEELRFQFNVARDAPFTDLGLTVLRGTPIDPTRGRRMYSGWFHDAMQKFRLPEFELSTNKETGQFNIQFKGLLSEVSLWEIPCMHIISELYMTSLMRKYLKEGMTKNEFAAFYSAMFARFAGNVDILKQNSFVNVAEMGTRRRHSLYIQHLYYKYARSVLGNQILGSSNIALSILMGTSDSIGTNAHELPMVKAAITEGDTDEEIFNSPYEVIRDWARMYPEIMIGLPDTFGTTAFLKNAPKDVVSVLTGFRSDSKDPIKAIDELDHWWNLHGVDLDKRFVILSDGLTFPGMVDIYEKRKHKASRMGFGNGTRFTNDCKGLNNDPNMRPLNIVCKVTEAGRIGQEMRPCVKLSDQFGKRTGPIQRVKRFEGIFGTEGHE